MKLLIIAPAWNQGWWGKGKVLAPPLVLPLLAGSTPKDVEIQLLDENVEPVDFQAKTDWVAITCMTASANRAYDISDAFRARGIPVVMGGIHPTVMPDEAAEHADAIVVGEAEPVWQEVLADFAAKSLKPRYESPHFVDLVGLPLPRRDLLRKDRYLTTSVVQTARGCPNGCEFCSVSAIAGKRFRFRPVPEVVEEVRHLDGWVGFVDDNIAGNARRAKELFEALIPLKFRWIGQADLSIAKDRELLRLMVRSGCQGVYIGLESVSEENLRTNHKLPNIGINMEEAIHTIHKAGIGIIGSFVLGLDGDDRGVFARTAAFAEKNGLDAAQFSVITPFPGTVSREKLVEEGRVFDNNWSHYTMSSVVFHPKQMTGIELRQGQRETYKRFYSLPSILRRSLNLRNVCHRRTIWILGANMSYRQIGDPDTDKGLTRGLPTR